MKLYILPPRGFRGGSVIDHTSPGRCLDDVRDEHLITGHPLERIPKTCRLYGVFAEDIRDCLHCQSEKCIHDTERRVGVRATYKARVGE